MLGTLSGHAAVCLACVSCAPVTCRVPAHAASSESNASYEPSPQLRTGAAVFVVELRRAGIVHDMYMLDVRRDARRSGFVTTY